MAGAGDLACSPERNAEMERLLPHAELCIIPGVRHSMLAEAPETIAHSLRAFLAPHMQAQDMA